MDLVGTLLKIPRGSPGLAPMSIELQEILDVEKRMIEISYVNKQSAFELMSTFIIAASELRKILSKIKFEYSQAVKHAQKRRSIILLDEAPEILEKKGLSSSKDLRDAVVDQDLEYFNLSQVVDTLEATHEYLRGKLKDFEEACRAVKKVFSNDDRFDDDSQNLHTTYNSDSEIGEPRYG